MAAGPNCIRAARLVSFAEQRTAVTFDFGEATGAELFVKKVAAAWKLFFPEKPKALSPKDEVKKRYLGPPASSRSHFPPHNPPNRLSLPSMSMRSTPCASTRRIFFPPPPHPSTPHPHPPNRRLRMILVADRCGLSPGSMEQMKLSIMKSLESFVDIEALEKIDINVTSDDALGTIYSVNVPVSRVKPRARASIAERDPASARAMENAALETEGITLTWTEGELSSMGDASPDDRDSVANRFPYGA